MIISHSPKLPSGNCGATKDYFIILGIANELAMVERNGKGKQAHAATPSTAKNNSTNKNIFPLSCPRRQPSKPASKKQKNINTSTT